MRNDEPLYDFDWVDDNKNSGDWPVEIQEVPRR